jgi:hypothetical protein
VRRVLVVLALLALPRAVVAQERPAPLEGFVSRVAGLWAAGDASALVALAPSGGRLVVDLGGDGGGAVEGRHAAAALRSLFGSRETVSVRSNQVTVSGGTPPRGFGELAWTSRERGVRDADRSVVYVGAEWEDGAWRIRELRLIR